MPSPKQTHTAPEESAREAGLRYVTDARPGIRRTRSGKSFRYLTPEGKPLHNTETLARIRSLVIPPAWTDVWICPVDNGHLQATGRDARGRKQSRYHPRWREVRDADKYGRMAAFARALPRIRRHVQQHLKLRGMPREKVLATIVSIMEQTHIRVGNEEYARTNKSYGLTTLRNRHVDVHGSEVIFDFAGKSGVRHTVSLHDQRLAKIIRQCAEIPGHDLFQYLDHDGNRHAIDSTAVNDYLRQITGEHFTAKDFRTWAGSVLACDMLRTIGSAQSETQAKKNIVEAIKKVAAQLGNTPAVCRKCYVHPAVLEAYLGGISTQEARRELDQEIKARRRTLHAEEHALLDLISQRNNLGSTSSRRTTHSKLPAKN